MAITASAQQLEREHNNLRTALSWADSVIGEAFPRPYRRPERPDHREIVCFCERVTRGEVADAMRSPVAPADLDGLRRRTRALMGRCQGFFCGAEVRALLTDARDTW